jgi:ferredoxin
VSFLSAAERFAAIDRSEVVLDASQCLHSHDQFSDCKACFDVCPADAIRPGKPPALDANKCQTCLACLPACPVGAYSSDDAVQPLLTCVARLETKTVELICALHGAADAGSLSEAIGIRVQGCLAGLGTGTYLALVAMGLERIILRLDACGGCPWGSLQTEIQTQVDQTGRLLKHWGKSETLVCVSKLDEPVERPLWDVKNPPLSRRDLFRLAAQQGQLAMARAMNVDQAGNRRRPGRDRLRLISAIQHLPKPKEFLDSSVGNSKFGILSVSEECNACATCARACPTGALTFEHNNENTHYWLNFTPQTCIGCEVCVHVCAPDAIEMDRSPTFTKVFGNPEPCVLSKGELKKCVHCKTLFAARSDRELCPVCEYRRKNPFGSMMPPGIKMTSTQDRGKRPYDS